jgi:hypothetical protein
MDSCENRKSPFCFSSLIGRALPPLPKSSPTERPDGEAGRPDTSARLANMK